MPRRAQEWVHRLDGGGAQRPSRDRREAHRRARRREPRRVRPSPSARQATSLVADFADCAVRQDPSADLCGAKRPHQMRRGAARRRRRPDRLELSWVTLRRPQPCRRAAHRIGPYRRRRTPRQEAEYYNELAAYDAAVAEVRACIVHALLLRPASHAMPRHARSTAQTALFGLRRNTRGVMCASHCVVSAGVNGRQRVGREHSTLRLTLRGTALPATNTGT
jgi:hypothetical protein